MLTVTFNINQPCAQHSILQSTFQVEKNFLTYTQHMFIHMYIRIVHTYMHKYTYLHVLTFNTFICLATHLMIKNITCYAYFKSIRLKWSPPTFPPYFYLQTITCKLRFHNHPYVQTTLTLERYATSSGIGFLKPKSHCLIKLTAVYNPASLDPGIYISVLILSECEFNHCSYKHAMYGYVYNHCGCQLHQRLPYSF